MRVLSFLASAVAALATVAYAQTNPFSYPVAGNTLQAGSTVNIKWNPTTQGTVTLVLRNGVATDLNPGTKIASNIPNNGQFSYTLPQSTVQGSDYTFEIIADSNPNLTNYTPVFTVSSSVTMTSSSASMSMTSMSGSMSTMTGSSMTGSSSMGEMMSSTISSPEAAGTMMTGGDMNGVEGRGAGSGFAAIAALAGVVAML